MQIKLQYHFVEKFKIYSHQKNISSNQFFSNSFSKPVTFTKFLPKMSERKFPQCEYSISRIFRQINANEVASL